MPDWQVSSRTVRQRSGSGRPHTRRGTWCGRRGCRYIRRVGRMMVADAVQWLFERVNSGALSNGDQVPVELAHLILGEAEHIDVAEYLADKFGITRGAESIGED